MPGLAELFAMFGGMGGAGNHSAPCEDGGDEGGMDSILVILLMFLLKKESADQGLLLALMYIMM